MKPLAENVQLGTAFRTLPRTDVTYSSETEKFDLKMGISSVVYYRLSSRIHRRLGLAHAVTGQSVIKPVGELINQ